MHKDIDKFINHLCSLGIKSHIITNGALLSPALTERIVDAGISTIKLVFWVAIRINIPSIWALLLSLQKFFLIWSICCPMLKS